MQKNWIGRSEGVEIDFPVEGMDEKIRVFTTRPDTLWGATFVCLAPGHPLSERLVTEKEKLASVKATYGEAAEKEGVFTGFYAVNPMNNGRIPIYIASFVLMEYGTGAIMSVPAHDQRDFDFAEKYGLPIKVVIVPEVTEMAGTNPPIPPLRKGVRGDCPTYCPVQKQDHLRRLTKTMVFLLIPGDSPE